MRGWGGGPFTNRAVFIWRCTTCRRFEGSKSALQSRHERPVGDHTVQHKTKIPRGTQPENPDHKCHTL